MTSLAELNGCMNTTRGDNIEVWLHTKRSSKGKGSVDVHETLEVKLPLGFSDYDYMVATDIQGCALQGTKRLNVHPECNMGKGWDVGPLPDESVKIDVCKGDKLAFVHIVCSHPEKREFTKFVNLDELRGVTENPSRSSASCSKSM